MDIYRKIIVGCNFATLKNGIFCRVVTLVIFCKNVKKWYFLWGGNFSGI